MKHPNYVQSYNGSLSQLEEKTFDLNYCMQERFLSTLSNELDKQAVSDFKKGRFNLSNLVSLSSININKAKQHLNSIILFPKYTSNVFIKDFNDFSVEKLAYEISIMTYDKTSEFIKGYSHFFISEMNNQDEFLNLYLNQVYNYLKESTKYLDKAWKICIPFMNEENMDLKN